jgi:hypothetical protein
LIFRGMICDEVGYLRVEGRRLGVSWEELIDCRFCIVARSLANVRASFVQKKKLRIEMESGHDFVFFEYLVLDGKTP